jgi:hypothetical protein
MTVTHRHPGQIRAGRLYSDGYQLDPTSTRPFDAGLTSDLANGFLCHLNGAASRSRALAANGEIKATELV